ncbi:GNAT family N-acetyltransferase [Cohaesibacter gelatinilyticus]|uniref:Protein N-acetyltransferase, RimJ/RimL family n=1 Tax=Cohaesibacter gelatinilyticus TaxID=372072 RepID=A0A285PDA9_9HYPH|nr:GNAT family protein [Cohaesibacter gelatinilyticus]SNZ19699.1 Protein N-acetyltransferase, RimJ/RimL family [Cohaesibacter gelatinilyticus]
MLDIDEGIQQDEPDSITPLRIGAIILRFPQSCDQGKLAAIASNPRIAKNLSAESCAVKCNQLDNFSGRTLIIANSLNQPLGMIGYQPDHTNANHMLSIWLDEACWNRGYGTLATQAMLDLAFSKDNLDCIFALARVSSMASKRLLEKCGFQYCGTGMTRSAFYKGMIPTDRFKLDRRVWQALRDWNHLTPNKGAA